MKRKVRWMKACSDTSCEGHVKLLRPSRFTILCEHSRKHIYMGRDCSGLKSCCPPCSPYKHKKTKTKIKKPIPPKTRIVEEPCLIKIPISFFGKKKKINKRSSI